LNFAKRVTYAARVCCNYDVPIHLTFYIPVL
jgi:hypothetical protein